MDWKNVIADLKKYGISQCEIQRRTGIRQSTLSRINNGKQADLFYANGVKLLDLAKEAAGGNQSKTAGNSDR